MSFLTQCSRPFSLVFLGLFAILFAFLAISTDTMFYQPSSSTSFRALFATLYRSPTITPLNNILYNIQSSNLAEHGLHPHYQHFLVNLPQLLGPAFILLLLPLYPFITAKLSSLLSNPRFTSALGGTLLLSIFPHQEPRFLLPCIPLLLTCIRLPTSKRSTRLFWTSWITFNALFGILMGIYHQGGIIPTQIAIPSLIESHHGTRSSTTTATVFWWKTYPAPRYLLGNTTHDITTIDLMGFPISDLPSRLETDVASCPSLFTHSSAATFFVAPLSAPTPDWKTHELNATQIWTYRRHINLDDLDIPGDGLLGTLRRVVGRRGLGVWTVERIC